MAALVHGGLLFLVWESKMRMFEFKTVWPQVKAGLIFQAWPQTRHRRA